MLSVRLVSLAFQKRFLAIRIAILSGKKTSFHELFQLIQAAKKNVLRELFLAILQVLKSLETVRGSRFSPDAYNY